jgi:two-component system chemotaxis sensor kinase CheA
MSDPELTELFRTETERRLSELDTALLAVESGAAGAETVDSVFRNMHTIKGAASMLGFDDIRDLAHAAEDVLAAVRAAGSFPAGLAAPLLRATAALRALLDGSGAGATDLLAELAAIRVSPDSGSPPRSPPAQPPAEGPAGAPAEVTAGPPADPGAARTLRVPAGKIDRLLDLAGEIMQYRNRLGGQDDAADSPLLDDLRDTAVGMRTLPLSEITGRLPRTVRDLARAAGKDVEFVVTGAATEIDRVILESLSEPLEQLLSNAVVHGIEAPDERARAGKPERGRIELRAVPRGSLVEIVVADDGRGAAPAAIEQARGQDSLADVLAEPGYSTAEQVTSVAGRGVGMDAVRAYAHSLGGSLEVRSEPGRGTQVIALLPLALALMEVLLVERGSGVYGVPLAAVEEVRLVTRTATLQGVVTLPVGGRSVPVADLAGLVGAPAPPLASEPPGLLISASGHRAVVACDAVLRQEEVVVKPLGPLLVVPGYLGAAILGDGQIALLLDAALLTRRPPPIPAPPVPAPSIPAPSAQALAAPAPRPPAVLVVEDSFTVRELQRSILEAAGYPVVTARDGRDALSILQGDAAIGLVISDLDMPGLDGIALTRAIRAGGRPSLPVVIVTSHDSDGDRRRGIEAGADAYLAKQSFDQAELLGTVERLVGR